MNATDNISNDWRSLEHHDEGQEKGKREDPLSLRLDLRGVEVK